MNRKWFSLLVILLISVSAYGGDPWKEKTYKQWDEKDVRRILDDSPWSKPVSITAMWQGAPGEGSDASGKAENQPVRNDSGYSGAPAAAGSGQNAGSGSDYAQIRFWVRWFSARTVLQARARLAILKGTPETDAEKILYEPATEHQIIVVGQDMSPFSKTDEIGLKEKSFIRLKKTKQKLSPSRVELIRSTDGKRIAAVVLHFPLKSDSGEPLIARDEKGVDFECRAGPLSIRTTFEPPKMVSKDGPDL